MRNSLANWSVFLITNSEVVSLIPSHCDAEVCLAHNSPEFDLNRNFKFIFGTGRDGRIEPPKNCGLNSKSICMQCMSFENIFTIDIC